METGQRPETPGRTLLRKWPWVLLLIALGAGAGAGLGLSRPTTYFAQAQLAVGAGDFAASFAGGAQGSQQIADNYARLVNAETVLADLPRSRRAQITSVQAAALPNSNQLAIFTSGRSLAAARDAAATTAAYLIEQSEVVTASNDPNKTLTQYMEVSRQVADTAQQVQQQNRRMEDAQADEDEQKEADARERVLRLSTQQSALQVRQTALGMRYQNQINSPADRDKLQIVKAAAVKGDDTLKTLQIYAVGGAGLAAMLAYLMALASIQRSQLPSNRTRPPRHAPEVDGALSWISPPGADGSGSRTTSADEYLVPGRGR